MVVVVLLALAARVDAAPGDDSRALAVRYADILTGVDRDDVDPAARDVDDTDDIAATGEADDADEAAETDDADEAAETDDADDADEAAETDDADDADDIAGNEADDGSDATSDGDLVGMAAYDPFADSGQGHNGDGDDAGAITGDDVSFAAASAGAAETYESSLRHRRPSPWGRLDLGVAWRRRWSEPMHALSNRYDELWLVATWRR